MIITKIGYKYIPISISCLGASGVVTDPSSAEVWFYKVSQVNGTLSLETTIGGTGKVTLTKIDSQTGHYGAGVDISGLTAGVYKILFQITINGIATQNEDILIIDDSKNTIDDIYTSVGDGLNSIIETIDTNLNTANTNIEETLAMSKANIEMISSQQVFSNSDNDDEIIRYNLLDADGNPTIKPDEVAKRIKV
jgi:hypothetical protein